MLSSVKCICIKDRGVFHCVLYGCTSGDLDKENYTAWTVCLFLLNMFKSKYWKYLKWGCPRASAPLFSLCARTHAYQSPSWTSPLTFSGVIQHLLPFIWGGGTEEHKMLNKSAFVSLSHYSITCVLSACWSTCSSLTWGTRPGGLGVDPCLSLFRSRHCR